MLRRVIASMKYGVKQRFYSAPRHATLAYEDYKKLQWRHTPLEFVDARVRVLSSFVFVLSRLGKQRALLRPKMQTESTGRGERIVGYDARVLDVGTRDGFAVELFRSIGFANSLGVELFEDYVKYAQSKGRNVEQGDIHQLPFDDASFDIVYCRHTLEHALDPQKAVTELYRVLSRGGALYVSLPMEFEPSGKHTVAIPSLRILKDLLMTLSPAPTFLYCGRSSKVGILEEGMEACALLLKPE